MAKPKNTQPLGGQTTYASFAGSAVIFIITMVLFVGGMVLMGRAFALGDIAPYAFVGGLLASSFALVLVWHLVRMFERE